MSTLITVQNEPQAGLATPNPGLRERIEHEIERDPRLQSEHTRRAYRVDLKAFEAWRRNRALTKTLVEEYAAQLSRNKRSPNSINRALAAVRWWARRLGDLAHESEMPKEQRDEIVGRVARVVTVADVGGDWPQRGRHIAPDELSALLQACSRDQTPAGVRDAALIAMAWSTGLRRSELCGLALADLQDTDGQTQARVKGKGNKYRTVYLHRSAARRVAAWLRERGSEPGRLFCPVRKGGQVALRRGLSDRALALILDKRCRAAALEARLTWHDFRRTFAGNLLDEGVDLVTVQKLLGHASPTTTSNYDRRGEDTKRRAVQRLKLPD